MRATVQNTSKFDTLIIIMALALIMVAAAIGYYFSSNDVYIRLITFIVTIPMVIGMIWMTAPGKKLFLFMKESRIELMKVTWPTREETTQSTLIVFAMIFLMCIILWAVDSCLLWIIAILSGQRG